jgi:hypothetical protein
MKIDKSNFEQTARAVYTMNPSAWERYDTWEDLELYMVACARMHCHDNNSFSTNGFQLTFFKGHDGKINCRTSVSSYTALKYLENQLTRA